MKFTEHLKALKRTDAAAGKLRPEDSRFQPLIISLLLIVVTLMVYWPARQFDFLCCDDPLYYTENAHVLAGLNGSNVVWAFITGDAANWHPLTWLSLMLDAECFGDNPQGPHLVNLLFHAANVVLLFLLLRGWTGAVKQSALVAALFALHPLHVESVAWIAERKDLLCGFFMLLTLMAYAKNAPPAACRVTGDTKNVKSPIIHHASRFYFLSLFVFACALMSKPMAVTLPFLLLLLDWWPLNRIPHFARPREFLAALKPLALEKIPFFALSVVASLITLVVQQKGNAVGSLATFPLSVRLENTFVSYGRYLAKLVWPATLANPYPYPGHWPIAMVTVSTLVFLGSCGAAFWLARKFPFVFTGWFWFAGMLVPVIGLVQVGLQSMADRYVYLPMIGLLVAFVWGLASAIARWNVLKAPIAVVLSAILVASAVKTRDQLGYWRNDFTLFSHTLAVTGNNYLANVNLGTWYEKHDRIQEALDQYNTVLKVSPDAQLEIPLFNVGNAYTRLGKLDEAIDVYQRALRMAPNNPNILVNLGCVLLRKQQLPEAITNFEAALKLKPDFATAQNNLATALFKQGRFEEAARHYYAAIKLAPDNPVLYSNLGDTMIRAGKLEAAAECYQQALQLEPGNPEFTAKLNSLHARPAN